MIVNAYENVWYGTKLRKNTFYRIIERIRKRYLQNLIFFLSSSLLLYDSASDSAYNDGPIWLNMEGTPF